MDKAHDLKIHSRRGFDILGQKFSALNVSGCDPRFREAYNSLFLIHRIYLREILRSTESGVNGIIFVKEDVENALEASTLVDKAYIAYAHSIVSERAGLVDRQAEA